MFNKLKNKTIMEKELKYIAPEMEILGVQVEFGFAGSTDTTNPRDEGDAGWFF